MILCDKWFDRTLNMTWGSWCIPKKKRGMKRVTHESFNLKEIIESKDSFVTL